MDKNNRKDNPKDDNSQNKKPKGNIVLALVIAVAVVLVFAAIYNLISGSKYTETTYNDFLAAMNAGNLAEVEFQYDRIIYLTKEEAEKPANQQKACYTGLPRGGNVMELSEKLDAMGVENKTQIVEDNSTIIMVLFYALMLGAAFLPDVSSLISMQIR